MPSVGFIFSIFICDWKNRTLFPSLQEDVTVYFISNNQALPMQVILLVHFYNRDEQTSVNTAHIAASGNNSIMFL
jgi:hypothetical protein